MSKLEELVPPWELCKLIPEGEFEDSALIWINGNVIVRVADIPNTFPPSMRKNIFPAPTLEEIMKELPPYSKNERVLACCVPDWANFNARVFGEHWRVGYTGDASICDKSPATAATIEKLKKEYKG